MRIWLERWGLLATGVCMLVATSVGFYLSTRTTVVVQPTTTARPADTPTPLIRSEVTALWLAVTGDPGDGVAGVLLVGGGPGVQIGSSTGLETPGAGPRSVEYAIHRLGGATSAVAVANALGTRVPGFAVAGPEAIEAVLGAGTVTVDVPQRVAFDDGVEIAGGAVELDAPTFVRYMTGHPVSESFAGRLDRQAAGWSALLTRLDEADAAAYDAWSTDVRADALDAFVAANRATSFVTLPVLRSGLKDVSVHTVDPDQLSEIRAAVAPVAVSRIENGDVRLLIGADVTAGIRVAARLVDAGYTIVLSGTAVDPPATSSIVVSADVTDAEAAGRAVGDLVGISAVEVRSAADPLADIMLTVGTDLDAERLAAA